MTEQAEGVSAQYPCFIKGLLAEKVFWRSCARRVRSCSGGKPTGVFPRLNVLLEGYFVHLVETRVVVSGAMLSRMVALATCGSWALEKWLVWLRSGILNLFDFNVNVKSDTGKILICLEQLEYVNLLFQQWIVWNLSTDRVFLVKM